MFVLMSVCSCSPSLKNSVNVPYAWKTGSFDTDKERFQTIEKRIKRLEVELENLIELQDRYFYNSASIQQKREKKRYEALSQELRELQVEREKLLKKF